MKVCLFCGVRGGHTLDCVRPEPNQKGEAVMKWENIRKASPEYYDPRPNPPRTFAEPLCDMANRMREIAEACEFGQLALATVLVQRQLQDTVALARWIAAEKRRKA